jgi:hypothetical protein
MPIRRRDARMALLQKGFREEGRHHGFLFFYYQGKKTNAYTYLSHGPQSRDIDESLLKKMRRELQLDTSKQARDILECPLDGLQFAEILRKKGFI